MSECALCLHYESEHDRPEPGVPQRCRVRYYPIRAWGANAYLDLMNDNYEPCSCPGWEPDKEDNN